MQANITNAVYSAVQTNPTYGSCSSPSAYAIPREPLLTKKKEILFSMLFGPDWPMIVETIEALEKL